MVPRVTLTRRIGWIPVVAVAFSLSWSGCGGASVDGTIGPTGGELCLPDKKVCITVPSGALEIQEVLRITPGAEVPGGALSEGYEISAVSGRAVTFLKAATVRIALDAVDSGAIDNLNILRVYTKETGADWQPLEKSSVDRVLNVVTGETKHLSPFVVLRADRLPDGGFPVEIDAGAIDASVIVIPPFDAGRPDAGRPDAGAPDAGVPDAGTPDAGAPDAGAPDAGTPDAGTPDAGTPDAGTPDAGTPDAGPPDAGTPDAGTDAGDPDAGPADAGDAG